MNKLTVYCLSLCMIGAVTTAEAQEDSHLQLINKKNFIQSYTDLKNIKEKHIPIIYKSEKNSEPAGKAVLSQARKTALENKKKGENGWGCWDYLDYVFKKSGFPQKKRKTIFHGEISSGPYIDVNKLQAGDWLYYINHGYGDIGHSGMFVGWVDKAKNKALMFSYAGASKAVPARYKTYDLSHVYNVMRPDLGNESTNDVTAKLNKTLPVANPVAKPETAPVVKPETAPVAKLETAPVAKLETNPVVKLETAPVAKLETNPVVKLETAPVAKLETAPVAKLETAPVVKLETNPVVKLETNPKTNPLANLETSPVDNLVDNLVATLATNPVANLIANLVTNLGANQVDGSLDSLVDSSAVSPVDSSADSPVATLIADIVDHPADTPVVNLVANPVANLIADIVDGLAAESPVETKLANPTDPTPATLPPKSIGTSDKIKREKSTEKAFLQKYSEIENMNPQYLPIIYQAEQDSDKAALKILRQARKMTLDSKKTIVGTSQNYIKVLFERVSINHKDIFVGKYPNGGFINPHKITSGDWLSFTNHGYNDSEHSGVFVGWIDKSKNTALMLSYAGEGRKAPARYGEYDISHVYHVRRPTS